MMPSRDEEEASCAQKHKTGPVPVIGINVEHPWGKKADQKEGRAENKPPPPAQTQKKLSKRPQMLNKDDKGVKGLGWKKK